jgi:F-type H+-transporting ATPase subunit b
MDKLLGAFGIDPQLLIAQAINFGVLLLVLWYFLYRPVLKVLDERKQKVAQGVLDAKEATEKLLRADTDASETMKGAEKEADAILSSARDSASIEKARIVKEAELRAVKIESDADARAKEESLRTLKESEKEIARLAILAAEKTLRTG